MYSRRLSSKHPEKTLLHKSKCFAANQELNDVWFEQVKIDISKSTYKYLLW